MGTECCVCKAKDHSGAMNPVGWRLVSIMEAGQNWDDWAAWVCPLCMERVRESLLPNSPNKCVRCGDVIVSDRVDCELCRGWKDEPLER